MGFALKDVSLTIEDSEYFFILGPTGAGKTLLLETIMGFYKPDKGSIFLDGKDITVVPPEQRGIGYVSQTCTLFPHMTVRQNVEFGLKMRKTSDLTRTKMVDEVLVRTGLKSLDTRHPDSLSGGERQKVALARVMALQSKTILLDEPLTSVDEETATQLKRELKNLHEEGRTIVHVSHNQGEAFSLGNRIALMAHGAIVQVGNSQEVFLNPRNEFAARFLGYQNVFSARPQIDDSGTFAASVDGVTLKVTEEVPANCVIGIRPEDTDISTAPLQDNKANVLKGVVADWIDMGAFATVTCEVGFLLRAMLPKSAFIKKGIKAGDEVWVAFRPDAIKVIR